MADKVPVGLDVGSETAQLDIIHSHEEKQGRDNNTTIFDAESQNNDPGNPPLSTKKQSAFKSLGWLDRYLAVWILLAIILGILLGNFAPDTAAALNRGSFVGVSVPIGTLYLFLPCCIILPYTYKPILLPGLYLWAEEEKLNRKLRRRKVI